MQRKILYFINPISGTKNKNVLIERLSEKTTQQNIPFEIINTNKEGNYSFLKTKIKEDNITDIVICGGDGTVSTICSFLIGKNVNIGIIPMGSGNGLAYAAGISPKLNNALNIVFRGNTEVIDGFLVNEKFSCMLSGTGFDALVAHDFASVKKRGLFTYILKCFKYFFNSQTFRFTVEVNGQQIKTEAFFISIANSNQFGNYVTIAPMASLSDGLLDIIIVNKMNKLKLVYALIRQILMGKIASLSEENLNNKDIIYLQSESCNIYNHNLAPMHIDGEPVDTEEHIKIKIVKNAIRLIKP